MFLKSYSRWLISVVPICLAVALYPVSFDGKQVISIEAPLSITFDVLIKHLWQFHPFIINVEKIEEINSTCSSYRITDQLKTWNMNYTTSYDVLLNIDQTNFCLTSHVTTPWYLMQAFHQYCMHVNILKETTTIITDQFHGQSAMILKAYIRKKMLQSHKFTLDRLRKEMLIYSTA